MSAAALTLDEQFFLRIALKNKLVTGGDAAECLRVRQALGKRGKPKPLQEIMLDLGLLKPGDVDEIYEAQQASQVLRLDSLYGDVAVRLGLVSRAALEEAFARQREQRFSVRVGELLVDRGVLRSGQHREVLVELLKAIRSEEKEYIQTLRLKRRLASRQDALAGQGKDALSEAEKIRAAVTEVSAPAAFRERRALLPPRDTEPVRPAVEGVTLPAMRVPAALERETIRTEPPAERAPTPSQPLVTKPLPVPSEEDLLLDSDSSPAPGGKARSSSRDAPASSDDFLRDSDERPAASPSDGSGAVTQPMPIVSAPSREPAPRKDLARESIQEWLGLDSIVGSKGAAQPDPEKGRRRPEGPRTTAPVVAAASEPPEKDPTPSSGDELPESFFASNVLALKEGPSGAVATTPGAAPARVGGPKETRARAPERARLLESAIEEELDSGSPSTPGPGLAESDVLRVESDIENVEELMQTGARSFGELRRRPSSSAERASFSTDEYLRRRRRKRLVARLLLVAILIFVVFPAGAAVYTAYSNRRDLALAEDALAAGDLDAASRTAERVGWFGLGDDQALLLKRRIEFKRALLPVESARARRAWPEALEALRAVRDEFRKDFAVETGAIETDLSLAMHLDHGQRAEEKGDLAAAVAAYEMARRIAQNPAEPEAKVAAIRARLEAEVAEAEKSGNAEREIEAYRKVQSVFGGKEHEIETKILEYDLRQCLAGGDQAAGVRDYQKALGLYHKAEAAAEKLGRSEAGVDLHEKILRTRRLATFQGYFNKAAERETRGNFEEAVLNYRAALNSVGPDDTGQRALVEQRIATCEERRRGTALAVEVDRLWKEAVAALKMGHGDGATAALESLRAKKPHDSKVESALAFARGIEDMVYVPAGEFTMGNKAADAMTRDEAPERKVALPAFFMDKFETRNRAYLAYVNERGAPRPPHWQRPAGDDKAPFPPELAEHPVVNVSQDEARGFAEWASKRLPTEEEWEKAARGVKGQTFPWGEAREGVLTNVSAKISERISIQTKPVGTSIAPQGRRDAAAGDVSPFGIFDMGGNVCEWTASPYKAYPGNDAKDVDWDPQKRVIRGGSWRWTIDAARCTHRDKARPQDRAPDVGFRCVKDIPEWFVELK